jgi:hypothetical protein
MNMRASPKIEQTILLRKADQAPTLMTEESLQLEDKLRSNVRSSSSAKISVNHRLRCDHLSHEVMQTQSGDEGNIAQSKGIEYSERP